MSFIELDIKTTFRLLAIGSLIAMVMLMAYRHEGQERPVRWFLLSRGLQTVAWVLLSLRNEIPFMLSMHLANSLLYAGFSLEMIAFAHASPQRQQLTWLFAGIQVSGMALLWVFDDSRTNLVIVASIWGIALWIPAGFALLREPGASRLQKSILELAAKRMNKEAVSFYRTLTDEVAASLGNTGKSNSGPLIGTVAQLLAMLRQDRLLESDTLTMEDDRERFRKSIGNAIRRALDNIAAHDPSLAAHLQFPTLRLGCKLMYVPDPPLVWTS